MTVGNDFLTPAVRAECERVIPQIEDVKPSDAATTFLFPEDPLQWALIRAVTVTIFIELHLELCHVNN